MTNPEQPVLDAIDELVSWQMEEGRRRGDGPVDELDFDDFGPLTGSTVWPHWRRPLTPQPTLRMPTGSWWRCDNPRVLEFEIHTEQSLEWRTMAWRIRVAGELVIDCVVPAEEANEWRPYKLLAETDDRDMQWPVWVALRCPERPREGDWRAWDPAALERYVDSSLSV